MKKYHVASRVTTENGNDFTEHYECNGIEYAKNWTGNCIRLDDVESITFTKTGKQRRNQLKRGKYITIEKMKHWVFMDVIVVDNETGKEIEHWNDSCSVSDCIR